MAQKIPPGVIVAVIVLVVLIAAFYGWRTLRSGDITQAKIQYYDEQQKKMNANKYSSPQEAGKAGAPMGSASGAAPTGSR